MSVYIQLCGTVFYFCYYMCVPNFIEKSLHNFFCCSSRLTLCRLLYFNELICNM
jgi:hypothetical protein